MSRAVTDHALLRYIERWFMLDLEGIRGSIREMADEAVPAKDGEHHWHEASGTMLILGNKGQVITVLPPETAEKWAGRKLSDGSRVAADPQEATPDKPAQPPAPHFEG